MYSYADKYKFTEKWFDPMIPHWENLFKHYKTHNPPIKNVLEIGCYEGRATIFLCENVLEENTNYDVVDTFGGTLEESGMARSAELFKEDDDFIYKNFTHNISFHPQINFNINRGFSQSILPNLAQQGKKYDFIYIDASHNSDDTFVDAYYAHKMLNPGGLIIFDDFKWKDPNQPHPVNSPELGIRMFFTMYDENYQVVMQGYQAGAIKNKN